MAMLEFLVLSTICIVLGLTLKEKSQERASRNNKQNKEGFSDLDKGDVLSRVEKALSSLYAELDVSNDFKAKAALDEAFHSVQESFKPHKQHIKQAIEEKGIPPEKLVSNLVLRICDDALTTGKHHIYRGILSDKGRGYLNVFRQLMNIYVERGYVTQGDADDKLKELDQCIKEIG